MDKPDQIRWNAERRAKYALLIQEHSPWKTAGVKSLSGKSTVRWNGLQTGRQSSPVLAVCRLLHQTKRILRQIKKDSLG